MLHVGRKFLICAKVFTCGILFITLLVLLSPEFFRPIPGRNQPEVIHVDRHTKRIIFDAFAIETDWTITNASTSMSSVQPIYNAELLSIDKQSKINITAYYVKEMSSSSEKTIEARSIADLLRRQGDEENVVQFSGVKGIKLSHSNSRSITTQKTPKQRSQTTLQEDVYILAWNYHYAKIEATFPSKNAVARNQVANTLRHFVVF